MKTRVCDYCGKEFEVIKSKSGNYSTKRFCSIQCEELALYQRKCKYCGNLFLPKRIGKYNRHSRTEFCSKDCERAYNDENNRITKICKNCGKEFLPIRYANGNIGHNLFCSDVCAKEYSEKTRVCRVCRNCGKEFLPKKLESGSISSAKYCSKRCEQEYYDKYILKSKKCLCCGKEFKPARLENGKLSQSNYCSVECLIKRYLYE